MVSRAYTVAFEGVDARIVEVQCALSPGLPSFNIVGLPDKAVSEAKERVTSAIGAMALAMPSKRITVNMSPADLPKAGSHYDLPIALAVLAAMDVVPQDEVQRTVALGELSLDGKLVPIHGALPAAIAAAAQSCDFLCPVDCGAEAAWVGALRVTAPASLLETMNHFSGRKPLAPAKPGAVNTPTAHKCLSDIKGQERAKRALEIAAAGRHHLLMIGSPGSGKSMLAARLPDILPPLDPAEALETSMIHSIAGLLSAGGISKSRPFRDPHHTASTPAIVGGGRNATPGEISLAHNGVLFLDELPEFSRHVLDTLRQPLETGNVMVARANAQARYPCKFMLIAAANPCRCGYMGDPSRACSRAPVCGQDYLGRISGPLMDRFDLCLDVPPVDLTALTDPTKGETSETVAKRVLNAWRIQNERYADQPQMRTNADAQGSALDEITPTDPSACEMLNTAGKKFNLTARGYHRVLRVARTIADMANSKDIGAPHIAEALSFRVGMGVNAC